MNLFENANLLLEKVKLELSVKEEEFVRKSLATRATPQDNQWERVIINYVDTPREGLYRNIIKYWLPGDKKVPGQRKSELLTRFHPPDLRPEVKTQKIKGKDRRDNDCISGYDQYVPIN